MGAMRSSLTALEGRKRSRFELRRPAAKNDQTIFRSASFHANLRRVGGDETLFHHMRRQAARAADDRLGVF